MHKSGTANNIYEIILREREREGDREREEEEEEEEIAVTCEVCIMDKH